MKRRGIERLEQMRLQAEGRHETTRLARYVATSVAQGAPRQVAAILSVAIGTGLLAGAGALKHMQSKEAQEIASAIELGGKAMFVVAGVNEVGQVLQDVALALHGQSVAVTYDVTDVPHTLSTTESNSTSSSGLLGGDLAQLLGAGALGAGGALATKDLLDFLRDQQKVQNSAAQPVAQTAPPVVHVVPPVLGPPLPVARTPIGPVLGPPAPGDLPPVLVPPRGPLAPHEIELSGPGGAKQRVSIRLAPNAAEEAVLAAVRNVTPTGWAVVGMGAAILAALAGGA